MKHLFVLLTFLLLTGCGAKRLAVSHADSLLTEKVTNHIPLYSDQKEELKKDLVKFLQDTKPDAKEMIPVIDKIELSKAKVPQQYKKFEDFYVKLANRFSKLMAKYIGKLDSKQQRDFFRKLEKENKELHRKDREDIFEDAEKRFSHFVGSLSKEQVEILKSYQDYFYQRHKFRFERRLKLQDELKAMFETEIASPEGKARSFYDSFIRYQNDLIKNSKFIEILEKLVPTMTEAQKKNFKKEAQEIKDVLAYYLTVDY